MLLFLQLILLCFTNGTETYFTVNVSILTKSYFVLTFKVFYLTYFRITWLKVNLALYHQDHDPSLLLIYIWNQCTYFTCHFLSLYCPTFVRLIISTVSTTNVIVWSVVLIHIFVLLLVNELHGSSAHNWYLCCSFQRYLLNDHSSSCKKNSWRCLMGTIIAELCMFKIVCYCFCTLTTFLLVIKFLGHILLSSIIECVIE